MVFLKQSVKLLLGFSESLLGVSDGRAMEPPTEKSVSKRLEFCENWLLTCLDGLVLLLPLSVSGEDRVVVLDFELALLEQIGLTWVSDLVLGFLSRQHGRTAERHSIFNSHSDVL